MGDRSNRADDTERRIFRNGQPMITTDRIGFQKLNARNGAYEFQFGDLVIQPADLCFFQFQPAQFIGLFVTDLFDDVDGHAAGFHRTLAEFFEGLLSGGNGRIDVTEHAPRVGDAVLLPYSGLAVCSGLRQLAEDFLDHLADGVFGCLHDWTLLSGDETAEAVLSQFDFFTGLSDPGQHS